MVLCKSCSTLLLERLLLRIQSGASQAELESLIKSFSHTTLVTTHLKVLVSGSKTSHPSEPCDVWSLVLSMADHVGEIKPTPGKTG